MKLKRKQVTSFLQAATHAVSLPDRTPVDMKEVLHYASFSWTKFRLLACGSVYVQSARRGFEVCADPSDV